MNLCVLWACVVVCPPTTSRVTPLCVVWPARPNFSSLSVLDLAGQTALCAVCLGKPQSLVISHLQASGNDLFFEQSLCYATDIYNTGISFTAYERATTVLYRDVRTVSVCTVSTDVEYACLYVRTYVY